ncbi:phosphatase PAP2 family protein [Actinomadura verrucosospora]|uniref:PA-phosphatase-like phosphoesterase protein n=1 Tax=Actinomadura verrucosospora TaxID=46165 RepID=A0A7D3ZKU0_ACTVE|nr:phosphatase PAP2 family protein [Actinomadura verrucosospora]QKG26557.1 PA-phosphatase-like phosphoesterase protein [Actinomadura verrucosospora]
MLTGFMLAMSYLGSAGFYIPVLVVLYWCVHPRLVARAIAVLSFGSTLNTVLKLVWHAPRPFWTDPGIRKGQPLASFGMPSGHAQNAVVTWGFFASRTRRAAVWAAAAVVIALIGASRVYLGVHSLGQVVVGWAIGLGVLVLALWLEPRVVPWWSARPLLLQLAMALGISLAFLGGAWLAVRSLHGWHWPAAWAKAIIAAGGHPRPVTVNEAAAATGGLFGILAGLSVVAARGWFDAGGSLGRRLVRLLVGVAGAAVLSLLDLLPGPRAGEAFAVQALLGLWAAAGAPEAFVRLGLARRATPALTRPGDERDEPAQ